MDEDRVDEDRKNCIGDLLGSTSEKAKVGEFRKTAETKLSELNDSVSDEETAYRTARNTGANGAKPMLELWHEQDAAICKLRKQIETCHPDWKECIRDVVCKEVIQNVWQLRTKLLDKLGKPERELMEATADFDTATAQLDAWAKISTWIQARLTLNQELIDEICTLNNCTERLFVLYIFYFELVPAHNLLGERAAGQDPDAKDLDPERCYCADCNPPDASGKQLCGFPWLINPDDYNCKLAEVWTIWRDCGVDKAKAECAMDQVEVCRTQYEEASTLDAKRAAAKDALLRKDQRDQADCQRPPSSPDNPTQQMSAP